MVTSGVVGRSTTPGTSNSTFWVMVAATLAGGPRCTMPNSTRCKRLSPVSLLPQLHAPQCSYASTTRPLQILFDSTHPTMNMHATPSMSSTTSSTWAGMSLPSGAPRTVASVAMRGPTFLPNQGRLAQSRAASRSPPKHGFWPKHERNSSSDGKTSFPSPAPPSNFQTIYTGSTGLIPAPCGEFSAIDRLRIHHPTSPLTHAHVG